MRDMLRQHGPDDSAVASPMVRDDRRSLVWNIDLVFGPFRPSGTGWNQDEQIMKRPKRLDRPGAKTAPPEQRSWGPPKGRLRLMSSHRGLSVGVSVARPAK